MVIEALFLGFSTGTYCTMNCAPVLVPFLFGCEKNELKRNAGLVGTFLAARLAMYFVLAAVFSAMGLLVEKYMDPVLARRLSGYAYVICGISLLINVIGIKFPFGCKKKGGCKVIMPKCFNNDWVTVIITGLSVGLHICPPLWTAMIRSIFCTHKIWDFFYFIFFYAGTLPFFLPLLGIPFLTKNMSVLRRIARISQLLISLYFIIFAGFISIFFG